MKLYSKLIFWTGTLILFSSCKKMVELDPSPNLIVSDNVFANDNTALSALSGLYVQMRSSNLNITNGGLSVFTGLAADEIYNTNVSATADPFYKNSIPSNNSTIISNFWSPAYRNIYQCNSILEGVEKSTTLSLNVKKQITGEVKVIRGLYYFYLINLFGDVPLVLSTDYEINATLPRTNVYEVWQQIISDWQDAKNLLPENYPSVNRARSNKWTAAGLLARAYIFMENWQDAETTATSVIDAGTYSINANLATVFQSGSSETIWQIVKDLANTSEGATFIPSSTTVKPAYGITTFLLNSFETGDGRKANWIKTNVVAGQAYSYPLKYKVKSGSTVSEYEIVLRLAELYLLRAEARAHLNKISEGRQDLDVIRLRAGLTPATATDSTSLLAAIQQESRCEFFTEWGHRWLDLKRTNKADVVLGSVKSPNWQPEDKLFPIPQNELDHNPALIQNPGY